MKIIHVCSNFYSSKIYYNLFTKINEYDMKSVFYVPEKIKTVIGYYYNYENSDNINNDIIVSKIFKRFDRFFFFHKRKKMIEDMQKKIKIESDDYFMAHSTFTDGYACYKLNKKNKINYSVFLQNSDINCFFKKIFFLRKLGIKILMSSKHIIMTSTSMMEYFLNKYVPLKKCEQIKKKIIIIPFGIDDFYYESERHERSLNDRVNLLTVGNVNENKNQLIIAQTIEEMNKTGYNITYNIAGKILDDEYYKKVLKYSCVNYLGIKDTKSLITEYRQNDIFILMSKFETFGLVYAEALSQGMPIIYSINQGFDNQFNEGFVGYHADPNSIDDVSNKIKLVIDNYESIQKNCYEASKKFNWERIANEYYIAIIGE